MTLHDDPVRDDQDATLTGSPQALAAGHSGRPVPWWLRLRRKNSRP